MTKVEKTAAEKLQFWEGFKVALTLVEANPDKVGVVREIVPPEYQADKPRPAMHLVHNDLAPHVVRELMVPVLEQAGDVVDTLVVLESVIVGTVYIVAKAGQKANTVVFESVINGARNRIKSLPDG